MPGFIGPGPGEVRSSFAPAEVRPEPTAQELLSFARRHGTLIINGPALRRELGISSVRYAMLMNRLIDDVEAWPLAPEVLGAWRDNREGLRARRLLAVEATQ